MFHAAVLCFTYLSPFGASSFQIFRPIVSLDSLSNTHVTGTQQHTRCYLFFEFAKASRAHGGAGGHAALDLGVVFPSGGVFPPRRRGGPTRHAGVGIADCGATLQDGLDRLVLATRGGQIRHGPHRGRERFAIALLVCRQ